jgi:N-acetyl-beta-hexosaminidase
MLHGSPKKGFDAVYTEAMTMYIDLVGSERVQYRQVSRSEWTPR